MIEFDGLVQDCSNSSALAMELLQSCAEPRNYVYMVCVLWLKIWWLSANTAVTPVH